jgi:hypothetical protein
MVIPGTHHAVKPQAECAKLVLLAGHILLPQLAEVAEEHPPREAVSGLGHVQLRVDRAPVGFVVEELQHVLVLKMRP